MENSDTTASGGLDAFTIILISIAVFGSPIAIGAFACWIEKRQRDKKLKEIKRIKDLSDSRLQVQRLPPDFAISLETCQQTTH